MFKLGIIGYPLGHSISAVIQKAGLAGRVQFIAPNQKTSHLNSL